MKTTIAYIIMTILLTVTTTIVMTMMFIRKFRRTEKRINLIEGFLPSERKPRSLNKIGMNRFKESNESIEISDATLRLMKMSDY